MCRVVGWGAGRLSCSAGSPVRSCLLGCCWAWPLVVIGRLAETLGDPAVWLFLAAATGFYLADLPTLAYVSRVLPGRSTEDDRWSRREAAVAAGLLLVTFWTALVERAFTADPLPGWSGMLGGLLLVAGVVVRAAAVLTLGRGFITEHRFVKGQGLIVRGIYGWVRHPSETGNLAVALGACLLLASLWGLVVVLVGIVPMTVCRIRREERYLLKAFGPCFGSYSRRVKRLVPGLC